MKNTFLDTQPVLPGLAPVSKQKYLCPICESYQSLQAAIACFLLSCF